MIRSIDNRALTLPLGEHDIAAYRRTAAGAESRVERAILLTLVGLVLAALAIVTVVVPLGSAVSALAAGRGAADALVTPLLFAAGIAAIGVGVWVADRHQWHQRARMALWAEANGLEYRHANPDPDYPGLIFGHGTQRRATDHFRSRAGRTIDFGNYRYTTGSGKNRTTHQWGYLAVQLDRALPHMVLDSRANNGLFGQTNLPSTFDRRQVLSLEGNFDRYFTLYCPRDYERDALYVFTPDLMALAIDEAAPFDIEIVDRWLFVYSSRPFPLADPDVYARLLRIVDTVGRKALSQTDRYRDERIGDPSVNIVALRGARLRPSTNGVILVVALLIGAAVLTVMLGGG